MPTTKNKEIIVKTLCGNCYGDGEDAEYDEVCHNCEGKGKNEQSIVDWIEKKLGSDISAGPGLYTFDDMVKAFKLGTLAECGDFPGEDYIGAERIIEKYFEPIP